MRMLTNRCKALAVCALGALLAPASHAITINLVPTGIGNNIGVTGVTATAAPASVVGGGTLAQEFQVAKYYWESAILDPFTVTIEYGWGDTGNNNTLGFQQVQTLAGTPQRITRSNIVIRSQNAPGWFADPTPDNNSEYGALGTLFANAALCNGAANCAGVLTTGIVYSGATDPNVSGNSDLLTTVIHEMGHALGLSVGYPAYVAASGGNAINVTAPRPFAGATIFDNGVADAHLDPTQGNLGGSLMQPTRPAGVRRLPSGADILADCQVSSFVSCGTAASIPEPASPTLLLSAVVALVWMRRRAVR